MHDLRVAYTRTLSSNRLSIFVHNFSLHLHMCRSSYLTLFVLRACLFIWLYLSAVHISVSETVQGFKESRILASVVQDVCFCTSGRARARGCSVFFPDVRCQVPGGTRRQVPGARCQMVAKTENMRVVKHVSAGSIEEGQDRCFCTCAQHFHI